MRQGWCTGAEKPILAKPRLNVRRETPHMDVNGKVSGGTHAITNHVSRSNCSICAERRAGGRAGTAAAGTVAAATRQAAPTEAAMRVGANTAHLHHRWSTVPCRTRASRHLRSIIPPP